MQEPLDPREFRRILSHYPTGVCVITALDRDTPVGMVVGSFTSVSLDPMLVAFLPDRKSTTWPRIEAAGHFGVNVLAHNQQSVCRTFVSALDDKFADVPYRLSTWGVPILENVVAWIDCELHAVHEAGDHFIALGRVRALNVDTAHPPLVFACGEYGTFTAGETDELASHSPQRAAA